MKGIWDELIQAAGQAAQKTLGASEEDGHRLGEALAKALRPFWGGQMLYFHVEHSETVARVAAIWQAYSSGGETMRELAQRFGLTEQRVRQIVRAQRYKAKAAALEQGK